MDDQQSDNLVRQLPSIRGGNLLHEYKRRNGTPKARARPKSAS